MGGKRIDKTALKGLAQLDFKTYCKVTVIKTCGIGKKYTHRSTDQNREYVNREHGHNQLIFAKNQRQYSEENGLFSKWYWKHMHKKESRHNLKKSVLVIWTVITEFHRLGGY